MAENTGYWKVENPYLTPASKHKPLHPVGAIVATADLGAGKGVTEEQFAVELQLIGAIVPADAPAQAPAPAATTTQAPAAQAPAASVQAAPKASVQAPVAETETQNEEAPAQ